MEKSAAVYCGYGVVHYRYNDKSKSVKVIALMTLFGQKHCVVNDPIYRVN